MLPAPIVTAIIEACRHSILQLEVLTEGVVVPGLASWDSILRRLGQLRGESEGAREGEEKEEEVKDISGILGSTSTEVEQREELVHRVMQELRQGLERDLGEIALLRLEQQYR